MWSNWITREIYHEVSSLLVVVKSLVPSPSLQFVHLNGEIGKVAAVITAVGTEERDDVVAVNCGGRAVGPGERRGGGTAVTRSGHLVEMPG